MSWWGRYVGIPFADRGRDRAGCDCWGLVRLAYAEELGIDLPSYGEISVTELRRIAERMEGARDHGPWSAVHEVQAFDVLLMAGRVGGRVAAHVGLSIGGGRVLHTFPGQDSCVLPLTHHLISPLVLGWQRHKGVST